ncbi:CAP domain-containing protein [Streptomyces sp. J2-1]|uniref:CAP domain-containing protein n=1 Tax=Streptomyces corallincola TaxID=2851888 RepID=UPI001C37FFAD|nr:CAP domain-containing protein [Streptomyces corallincola]MBV2354071.1 CAP domain-containing protein [Streptomyces corallincola]
MAKHRKQQHYRRMVIAAVAVGAVGIPTAAVACVDWGNGVPWSRGTTHPADAARLTGDLSGSNRLIRPYAGATTASASPRPSSATPGHRPSTTPPKYRHHPSHPRQHGPKATSVPSPRSIPSHGTVPRAEVSASVTLPSPSAPAATPEATATATADSASGFAARIVSLVNSERAKVGCPALTLNAELTEAAQEHSADMASHATMSHTGSDGSDPGARITAAGYTWSAYGENVAYGYSTPEQVMAGWMASSGHRANILNCSFREIGVGLSQPGDYWTQDFGTAR